MKTAAKEQKCVFFDRDGVVNRAPSPEEYYVLSLERFFILPAFMESLRIVNKKGYAAVIVTNQRCIERGLITWDELNRIHDYLRLSVKEAGLELLDILVCPHGADQCECRKPKPGLFLEASRRYQLDLAASWMVGDSETDVEAGRAAGCRTVRIAHPCAITSADFHLEDMSRLPDFLSSHLT